VFFGVEDVLDLPTEDLQRGEQLVTVGRRTDSRPPRQGATHRCVR
jgi:hypothetical protein